jgi:hypothetical protein
VIPDEADRRLELPFALDPLLLDCDLDVSELEDRGLFVDVPLRS